MRSLYITVCCTLGWVAAAGDWSSWRGPAQQGHAPETNLPASWSPAGENVLWKADVGCRSTPLVLNDRVYMINRSGHGETLQERVVALDLNTGKTLWEYKFNVFLTDIVSIRVGWANIAADPETGNIYAHGVGGIFVGLDKDGKVLWEHSLTEAYGRISGYGGRTVSPVVDGDLVILSSLFSGWGPHAKPVQRFFALDKNTGEFRWWSDVSGPPDDTIYPTPVIATVNGQRVLFSGLADGDMACLQVNTGKVLWKIPLSKRGLNTSPVYGDGKVYFSQSEENLDSAIMGAVICLDAKDGKEIWRKEGIAAGYASPSLTDGMLIIPDNSANLIAFDAKTGEQLWTFNYGKEAKGSPTVADGKIYVGEVAGEFSILEYSRAGCDRLHHLAFETERGIPKQIFSTPAIAHGKVILTNMDETWCISKEPADFRSPQPVVKEADLAPVGPLAQVLLQPAEIITAPGKTTAYTLAGFDANGNPTGPVEATYMLKGLVGSVENGVFTAGMKPGMQAGMIEAAHGDLKSTSRVRIVAPLPYREDFESLPVEATPGGWITSKVKSQVTEVDGNKVLRKLAANPAPPFARLRCYTLPPMDGPYTVQADMMGMAKKNRWIPDMGLINQRYLLILTGTTETSRRLRLVSWAAVPRIIKEVEFDWKPDTWYSVKLSVDGNKASDQVMAKVWARGSDEPADWSLTMTDPSPNTAGSPGLYAYSVGITSKTPGTEVLFDNLEVTR